MKRQIQVSNALIFAMLLFSLRLHAQPAWIRDSLDFFVMQAMKTQEVPGLAIAVVQDGQVVLQRTYGVRAAGGSERVDENTLFMIGSNTKAYTGTMLALLDSEKKLNLDDKVTKWLPDYRLQDECATRMVTLRDMLCHRIGMQTFQGDFTFWGSTLSREDVMKKMAALVPSFDFRTRFGYCNSGFLTAGQVIPVATNGTTWEQMLRERIFKPLKMERALALSAELPTATNVARPHAYYDGRLQPLDWPTIDNLAPAGSISLSVSDMTHWIMMQLDTGRYAGQQIIPKNVILKTWEAQTIVSPRTGYAYGLGWFIAYPNGQKTLDHTGGVDGFLSASAFIPERRLGVVVLTNTDNNSLYSSLRDQLLQVYKNETGSNRIVGSVDGWKAAEQEEAERIAQLRQKAADKSLPMNILKKYAGRYTHDLYGAVDVKVEKNQLRMYLSHHPKGTAVLSPMGEHRFLCTFGTPTLGIQPLTFQVDDKGAVKGLTLKVNDFIEYGTYDFIKQP
jgi:CubicO group peptidase (beta-lactamase class C family)